MFEYAEVANAKTRHTTANLIGLGLFCASFLFATGTFAADFTYDKTDGDLASPFNTSGQPVFVQQYKNVSNNAGIIPSTAAFTSTTYVFKNVGASPITIANLGLAASFYDYINIQSSDAPTFTIDAGSTKSVTWHFTTTDTLNNLYTTAGFMSSNYEFSGTPADLKMEYGVTDFPTLTPPASPQCYNAAVACSSSPALFTQVLNGSFAPSDPRLDPHAGVIFHPISTPAYGISDINDPNHQANAWVVDTSLPRTNTSTYISVTAALKDESDDVLKSYTYTIGSAKQGTPDEWPPNPSWFPNPNYYAVGLWGYVFNEGNYKFAATVCFHWNDDEVYSPTGPWQHDFCADETTVNFSVAADPAAPFTAAWFGNVARWLFIPSTDSFGLSEWGYFMDNLKTKIPFAYGFIVADFFTGLNAGTDAAITWTIANPFDAGHTITIVLFPTSGPWYDVVHTYGRPILAAMIWVLLISFLWSAFTDTSRNL